MKVSPLNTLFVILLKIYVLPAKLYLVVFLSSEPSEPDKDDLFGIHKAFESASGKCLLYYLTCSYPMG